MAEGEIESESEREGEFKKGRGGLKVVADFGQSNFGQSIFCVMLCRGWCVFGLLLVCVGVCFAVCLLFLVVVCRLSWFVVVVVVRVGGVVYGLNHLAPDRPPSARPPKISRFFPSPATNFVLFFSSLCVFSLIFGGVWKCGTLKCARLEFSGCCVKPRPRRFQTPPKKHEKTPSETKRAKRGGRRKKTAKFLGLPPFGAPPFRARFFWVWALWGRDTHQIQKWIGQKWIGPSWIGQNWSNQDGQNGIGQSRSLPVQKGGGGGFKRGRGGSSGRGGGGGEGFEGAGGGEGLKGGRGFKGEEEGGLKEGGGLGGEGNGVGLRIKGGEVQGRGRGGGFNPSPLPW